MRLKKITSAKPMEKILSSASREFAKYGLAGARVDRIAARAKVNKAMIYYYFRSKENLYQTVIDQHLSKIRKLAKGIVITEADPELIFQRWAGLYGELFENREEIVPIFLREVASGGKRMNQALARVLTEERLVEKLEEVMKEGKRKGLFREVDTKQAIISFVGMNIYYLIMSPIVNSGLDIKDQKDFQRKRQKEVVDLFLHGLETK